ncbi:MAG: GGDEF domain-containing protein, partial [Oscillospiraceae bacterium]
MGALYARYITDLLTVESRMHLSEVATQGAASVQRQIARDFDMLEVLADGKISDPEVPMAEKLARIKHQADKFGLYRIAIVDLAGNAVASDGYEFSVADREFFQAAVKGQRFLSQPIIDKVDGVTPGIVYAVPVYHGGEVVSVLFSGYELDKLTDRIDISFYHDSGIAFIADSHANVILHPIADRIGNNIAEIAAPLNSAETVREFADNLKSGTSGVSHITMKTGARFFAYAPIIGANDWYLFASLPEAVVFERSQKVIFLTVLLLTGVLLLLALLVLYISVTRKRSNAKIYNLAYYDQLTGASNIERFKLDAEALFRQFGAQKYTLLNFDLKKFRYINNDLGYSAGNDLLLHVVACLKSASTKGETFTRVNTDQFLLLLFSRADESELRTYIESLRGQISSWQPPAGGYCSVRLAFGAYKLENRSENIASSIEKSNIARKAAKSAKGGGNSDIAVYNEEMQRRIDRCTELENAMPAALKNEEFKLFIQPKYDLLTEKIVGGEALVRWIKPDGTVIMPNDFIPLFEQSGAIYRMDMYMLGQLCKFMRSQHERGVSTVPISINQSRSYMYGPDYVDVIRAKLRESAVPPEMIELEITENLVYTDIDKLIKILQLLHQAGFKLSLDDFGSGYSSLNVLKELPVDVLKLDRFMLGKALNSTRGKTVIANIVRMANELNMSVVAEGVETREQVIFLRGCGCETAQGFYYSKPIPAKHFEDLL